MMNIFNSLTHYATGWSLKSSREFSEDEINAVAFAKVVPSQYGNSVCFHLKSGGQTFIPLSKDATVGVGDTVDLTKAKLLVLEQAGSDDITRVEL